MRSFKNETGKAYAQGVLTSILHLSNLSMVSFSKVKV